MPPHFRNRFGGQRGPELYEGDYVPPKGLIQNPTIQARLVKNLSLRERVPAPTLAPEISAVVIVEDLSRIDATNVKAVRPAMSSIAQAGDTLTAAWITFANPPDSQVDVHVKELHVITDMTLRFAVHLFVGVPGGAIPAGSEAFRHGELLSSRPQSIIRSGVLAIIADPSLQGRIVGPGMEKITIDIILTPNTYINLGCSSLVATLAANFIFEERGRDG